MSAEKMELNYSQIGYYDTTRHFLSVFLACLLLFAVVERIKHKASLSLYYAKGKK